MWVHEIEKCINSPDFGYPKRIKRTTTRQHRHATLRIPISHAPNYDDKFSLSDSEHDLLHSPLQTYLIFPIVYLPFTKFRIMIEIFSFSCPHFLHFFPFNPEFYVLCLFSFKSHPTIDAYENAGNGLLLIVVVIRRPLPTQPPPLREGEDARLRLKARLSSDVW